MIVRYNEFLNNKFINEAIDLDDISTSLLGHKKKIKTPEGIKVKVKGTTISKDELLGFFQHVKKYLSLMDFKDLKKRDKSLKNKEIKKDDLVLTYDQRGLVDKFIDKDGTKGSSIDIDYGGGRVVFKRKEGQGTDKIKMILLPRFLDNLSNDKFLSEFVDDILTKDEISKELAKEYDTEDDDKKISDVEEREDKQSIESKKEQENNSSKEEVKQELLEDLEPKKEITDIETAKKINNLLLSQRLYVSTAATDEEAIFNILVKGDSPLLLNCNNKTIDYLCDLYNKSPKPIGAASSNLNRDDNNDTLTDKVVKLSDWTLKQTGIDKYKSSGIVKDLLYAFDNLEDDKCSDEVLKELESLNNNTIGSINSNLGKLGLGIVGGVLVLKGIGAKKMSSKLMGKSASMNRLSSIKTSKIPKGGIKNILGKYATKVLGVGSKAARIGGLALGFMSGSIFWIGMALTAYEIGGWFYERNKSGEGIQVARILYVMQYSGSKKFKDEMKRVGISIDLLDVEKIKTMVSDQKETIVENLV